jgi:hypothetical protein
MRSCRPRNEKKKQKAEIFGLVIRDPRAPEPLLGIPHPGLLPTENGSGNRNY